MCSLHFLSQALDYIGKPTIAKKSPGRTRLPSVQYCPNSLSPSLFFSSPFPILFQSFSFPYTTLLWKKNNSNKQENSNKMPQIEKAECLKMTLDMPYITSKSSFIHKRLHSSQEEHSQPTKTVVSDIRTYSFSEETPFYHHLSTSCLLPESICSSLGLCKKVPKNGGCPSGFHFP